VSFLGWGDLVLLSGFGKWEWNGSRRTSPVGTRMMHFLVGLVRRGTA
jgi:hypothetical protein